MKVYSLVSGIPMGAVNPLLAVQLKGQRIHKQISVRHGSEISFQILYDLALCYRCPLLDGSASRILESIQDEMYRTLLMISHTVRYTKGWSMLTDHILELYYTFLTHLEQDSPFLWNHSLGAYYRALRALPESQKSGLRVPRHPFRRYQKASCLPKNLSPTTAPFGRGLEYPLVYGLNYMPESQTWPPKGPVDEP